MTGLLDEVYGAVTHTVSGLADADFERPTRTSAWNVRQLLYHQLLDAQRALVALATPATAQPDADEVSYWRSFHPSVGDGGAAHGRYVVRAADAFDGPAGLVDWWRTTSAAAVRAAGAADPDGRVETQGHVIAVRDLVSTLVVEATVHLLDLTVDLPADRSAGPPTEALVHTRRILAGLLGEPLPATWDDTEAVLRGTGRLPTDDPRLPLLG